MTSCPLLKIRKLHFSNVVCSLPLDQHWSRHQGEQNQHLTCSQTWLAPWFDAGGTLSCYEEDIGATMWNMIFSKMSLYTPIVVVFSTGVSYKDVDCNIRMWLHTHSTHPLKYISSFYCRQTRDSQIFMIFSSFTFLAKYSPSFQKRSPWSVYGKNSIWKIFAMSKKIMGCVLFCHLCEFMLGHNCQTRATIRSYLTITAGHLVEGEQSDICALDF